MSRFCRIDTLIVTAFVILGVGLFMQSILDSMNFYGAENLDRNRNYAESWLKKPRSRSLILERFGPPSNHVSDDIWVWLFRESPNSSRKISNLAELDYGNDGFWIRFDNDVSDGFLLSISGNIEEFEQEVERKRKGKRSIDGH